MERVFLTDEIDKISADFLDLEIGVIPGLLMFFDRHWAFETTVGIAGFSMRREKQIQNNDLENQQKVAESSIDLKINLLQLNLGIAYYF